MPTPGKGSLSESTTLPETCFFFCWADCSIFPSGEVAAGLAIAAVVITTENIKMKFSFRRSEILSL
jgi:hypothetical protein